MRHRHMRFVQFGDVHLDCSLGGALKLPPDKRATLRREIRDALVRACDLAAEHGAQLVMIPGDLVDYEAIRPDTAAFLADTFRRIAPIRIFLTPGNHDSLRPGSPYLDPNVDWPENVHVFTSPQFETVVLDEPVCSITGIAHAHAGITDRLLTSVIQRPSCPTSILLMHGSRDGYRPSEKENVIPFSDRELLNQGFTYTALGHYHSFSRIEDDQGRLRAAYSGCIQGRALDETGEKYVLLGEIDSEGQVTIKNVEVASRRVVSVEVDVTGSRDNETVLNRIEAAVDARECDLVNVSLAGALPPGMALDTSEWERSAPYFHVNVNRARVQPDYDLESISADSAAGSVSSEFVRRMLEREEQATDDDQRRVLRDAIYYGLYALDGKDLEPRDAN